MVHPVGLLGALTSTIRVPGVAASSRRCRSSDQWPAWHASGTRTTSALMMRGIAVRFGHTGVTIATRSPGSISVWSISDSACTPALVTAIAVERHGLPRRVQPVRVCRQFRTQFLDPEVVVVEGLPGVECRLGGLSNERGCDLVALTEPELQNVDATNAGVGYLTDARGGEGSDSRSDHPRIIRVNPMDSGQPGLAPAARANRSVPCPSSKPTPAKWSEQTARLRPPARPGRLRWPSSCPCTTRPTTSRPCSRRSTRR